MVDITFGQAEKAYHIIVEFYASGNLILTDHEYNILTLMRTHRYDEDTRCAVGEKYPFTKAANLSIDSIISDKTGIQTLVQEMQDEEDRQAEEAQTKGKKKKRGKNKETDLLKTVICKMVPFITPVMAEHCAAEVGLDIKAKLDFEDDGLVQKVIDAAFMAQKMVKQLEESESIPGYIVYDEVAEPEPKSDDLLKNEESAPSNTTTPEPVSESKKVDEVVASTTVVPVTSEAPKVEESKTPAPTTQGDSDSDEGPEIDPDELFKGKLVKEFVCFELSQMKSQKCLEFDWFDQCVDLYFTQIDKQKEQSKVDQKEAEIYKKVNRIKDDQLKRIEGLQKEADSSLIKAKILQQNINEVQAIIEIMHYLNGIQWKEIWRMIKEEKRSGNPLASIIHSLNLEHDKATLIFNTAEMSQNVESYDYLVGIQEEMIVKIDIELALSAQSNIQKYFEIKKKTEDKEERTKDKANVAIKQAEEQARRALKKTRNDQKQTITRKPYWFEKFDWFISSENYLIISGRTAQQNEELVKTYLGKRDVYVHSEMAGSASCIIKNPS